MSLPGYLPLVPNTDIHICFIVKVGLLERRRMAASVQVGSWIMDNFKVGGVGKWVYVYVNDNWRIRFTFNAVAQVLTIIVITVHVYVVN